jgi:uncharacterized protein YjiS (DUF1127 family)
MMDESLHGEFRLASLDRRGDERGRATRPPNPSVCTFNPAAQYGWPLWASSDLPLTGRVRRAETRHIALLRAIRRIVAAIRLWRGRARSQQQLRELDDRLLKDVGLRREDVGHEFPKPFWHCD